MSCKLALVDFDGTLTDSMPWWLGLPVDTLEHYGIPEPPDFRERIRSLPMWEIAIQMSAEFPLPARDKPLRDRWDDVMLRRYRTVIPNKPGAADFLRLLHDEGIEICVFSATHEPYLSLGMEAQKLAPLVDRFCDEHEGGSKHEAETYARFAAEYGCALSEILLVDDAPLNVATAARAGCAVLAVRDESFADRENEMRENAGLYVSSLTETEAIRRFLRSI